MYRCYIKVISSSIFTQHWTWLNLPFHGQFSILLNKDDQGWKHIYLLFNCPSSNFYFLIYPNLNHYFLARPRLSCQFLYSSKEIDERKDALVFFKLDCFSFMLYKQDFSRWHHRDVKHLFVQKCIHLKQTKFQNTQDIKISVHLRWKFFNSERICSTC